MSPPPKPPLLPALSCFAKPVELLDTHRMLRLPPAYA